MAMTMTSTGTGSAPDTISTDLIRTARTTGLLYLAFFITGISGSMLVRSQFFAADDAHALCRQGVPCGLGCGARATTRRSWVVNLTRPCRLPSASVTRAILPDHPR